MDSLSKLYVLGEEKDPSFVQGRQGVISPDGLEGDARGKNSTDFQFDRGLPGRVAKGVNSFIGGGQSNLVSGSDSFAAAGSNNEVAGDMGFVAGESNSVSGSHGAAFGNLNDVLGNFSFAKGSGHVITAEAASAEGDGNIVSGYAAHAEGGLNICDGRYSHAEGLAARAYNDFQHARASGGFSNPGEIGEAQYTNLIARLSAEENYPRELLVGEEGSIVLMDNKMNVFRILVCASNPDLSEGAAWELKGIISKNDTPESTTLIGAVSKTVISRSNSSWDIAAEADKGNGALRLMADAEPGQSIRWVAFVEMVEVAFYS